MPSNEDGMYGMEEASLSDAEAREEAVEEIR